ncbi:hypothetical protein SISSUDRAFT_963647, partial [Sistotremastrum suecicum HHB10207 ss-3]
MPAKPDLGSAALQRPSSPPQVVHVSASTCQNLSLFKDLMKEYRRLDDTINMRLNRNLAAFRDRDRLRSSGKSVASLQDESCAYFWRELVASWKGRAEIIDYCVQVVDQTMAQKRAALEAQETGPDAERKIQAALFGDQVKLNQIHNELAVEKIVRRRSLEAFTSRCRYFQPPMSDVEGREWWE